MIPNRITKMFARKLIFRTACGPIRSQYTQLLFVWVYGERRVRFCVISAPLKSWNPCKQTTTSPYYVLSWETANLPYSTHAPKCSILWTIGSWNNNLMPYHSFPYVIFWTGFPLIRCEPKRICLLDDAQKTQTVVRCSSKEKILKVRRFILHFLCIS